MKLSHYIYLLPICIFSFMDLPVVFMANYFIELLFFFIIFAELLKHILDHNSFSAIFGDNIFPHPLFTFCSIHVLNFDLVHL